MNHLKNLSNLIPKPPQNSSQIQNLLPNKGFSLVEIAIVLLVIGILVAGVSQGQDLYNEFNLTKARNLTKNSRVSRISNLELWLETSLEESFLQSQRSNNFNISQWNDINIQTSQKKTIVQNTSNAQPKFISQAFNNSIPGIRFDGNDFMSINHLDEIVNSNYTIFIVEQRRVGDGFLTMLGGSGSTLNTNLVLCYRSSNKIRQSHFGNNDMDYDFTGTWTFPIAKMHSFLFDKTSGKQYWINGGTNPDKQAPTQTSALISYSSPTIGKYYSGNNFNGDIAEIIIYSRELTTKERNDIEDYLSKKYDITIS